MQHTRREPISLPSHKPTLMLRARPVQCLPAPPPLRLPRTSFLAASRAWCVCILERLASRKPPQMLPRRPSFSPVTVTQSKRSVVRHTCRCAHPPRAAGQMAQRSSIMWQVPYRACQLRHGRVMLVPAMGSGHPWWPLLYWSSIANLHVCSPLMPRHKAHCSFLCYCVGCTLSCRATNAPQPPTVPALCGPAFPPFPPSLLACVATARSLHSSTCPNRSAMAGTNSSRCRTLRDSRMTSLPKLLQWGGRGGGEEAER